MDTDVVFADATEDETCGGVDSEGLTTNEDDFVSGLKMNVSIQVKLQGKQWQTNLGGTLFLGIPVLGASL